MRKYDFSLDLDTPNSNSLILKCIKPGSTVLEFGPAHGRMTRYLKEQLQCHVTIVELDAESGTEAAKYADQALIGSIEGDIESGCWRERLKEARFDYILFADVLEHLHKPSEILAKAVQLLNGNGSIVLSIPNLCHNSILIELWNNRFQYRNVGLLDDTHLRFFSRASLARMVHQNGLHTHVEHYARNVVENTEFHHSYNDVPAEAAKAMKQREHGDVYHFVWELKKAPWAAPETRPKISVLLPTYNYGQYLSDTIESVLNQDLPDFEFVISDDASTDNSAEIIRAYAARDVRIRYRIHEKNLGMVTNWNWCLEQARGDYIKYIFGDDQLAVPHALRTMSSLLDAHPTAVLATSARQIINAAGNKIAVLSSIDQDGLNKSAEVSRACLLGVENRIGEPSAVMFRARSASGRGFDENYRQLVDLEFWLRLLKQGDMLYSKEALCIFRRHSAQQTEANRAGQVGYHEHMRLMEGYLPHLRPPGSKLRFSEKRLLCHIVYGLENARNAPEAAKKLSPILKRHLGGGGTYTIFRIIRKMGRPFANARRAWLKYIMRDPVFRRTADLC